MVSRVVECPYCGWQSSSQGNPWTVLAAHKPHCGSTRSGWDAAPLREVPMSNGRGTKRRRDLRDLDPQFLAAEIEQAWPAYLSTFHKRNASIGAAIFDADDTEAELRLLLTEAATRFDGRGRFAGWACAKQRQDLLDCRRRQVGRSIADAELAISRGDDHALAADVATVHNLRKPLSIDALNSDGLALADILADNPQPITTTKEKEPMETPTMPAPETLLEHDNRRVARAAERVLVAQEALREAWEADAGKAALRAKRDRLKAQLAAVEAEIKGVDPSPQFYRDVRAWAVDQGLEVSRTGRVSKEIVAAYDEAMRGGAA